MKKITALILMMVICLSLSSCELLEQFLSDSKKDPEEVKDTTVTEEEWNAAFIVGDNITIIAENASSAKMTAPTLSFETEYVSRSTNINKYTETAWYSKSTVYNKTVENGEINENTNENDSYETLNNDDGEWYRVYKNSDGEWVASRNYKNSVMIFAQVETIIGGKINFSDFTFNSDKKAYTRIFDATRLGGTVPFKEGTIDIYFIDGAIVKIEITMSGFVSQEQEVESGEVTTVIIEGQTAVTITFSDCGTTKVEVPSYTILEY